MQLELALGFTYIVIGAACGGSFGLPSKYVTAACAVRVRVLDWQGDGGYPSSVQLPDGQVLTAYYAQKIEGHEGYHMGAVAWRPDESLEGRKP